MQNGYCERFNRTFGEDVLDAYIFSDIEIMRSIIEEWKIDYNENHPHSSLGKLTPIEFKLKKSTKFVT